MSNLPKRPKLADYSFKSHMEWQQANIDYERALKELAVEALEQIGKHPIGQQGMTARKALKTIRESEKP